MTSLPIPLLQIQGREHFPLPLVAIEQFMLWDDTTDYPKRFRVILDLHGELKRDLLETAIKSAAVRHPLTLAHLDDATKPPRWVIPERPEVPFRWLEGSWFDPPFPDAWNLKTESGVRVCVSQSDEQTYQVSFEVHHSTIDGLGLRQFVADMIIAYDHACAGNDSEPDLKKLLPERLLERGVFVRPKPSEDSRPTTTRERLSHAYSFHFRGPKALAKNKNKPTASTTVRRHIYRRVVLSPEQRVLWEHSLRPNEASTPASSQASGPEASKSLEHEGASTLNDLVVSRFLQVIADWNRTHGRAIDQQRLRIMIPTDLRSFPDGRLPAANRFGFGFVVSDVGCCSNLQLLVDNVTKQTQAIRKYSLGLDFVEIFGAFTSFASLAKRLVRIPRCMATGVLTNLGDLSRRHRRALVDASESIRIGNTTLESVTCFPPLRPKTVVGIGICGTRDSFTVGIVLDAKHGTVQDADALLAAMVRVPVD